MAISRQTEHEWKSPKNKVTESPPCCILLLSELALLNGEKNAAIKGQRQGNTTLQLSLLPWLNYKLFSWQQPHIQQEATTSLRHVNQQHSVADNYSNCHRKKTYNSNKMKLCVCGVRCSCIQVHVRDLRDLQHRRKQWCGGYLHSWSVTRQQVNMIHFSKSIRNISSGLRTDHEA